MGLARNNYLKENFEQNGQKIFRVKNSDYFMNEHMKKISKFFVNMCKNMHKWQIILPILKSSQKVAK